MNWQRWFRVVSVSVALTLVVLIVLPSLVGASPDTLTLRPNEAGDETFLTPNTGANWAAVDDDPSSDDDVTYVESGNSQTFLTDLYNLSDVTVSGKGKINSVTVSIHARAGNTPPSQTSAYTRIKTLGVAHDGSEQTLGATYATYSTAYTLNPQSVAEWTWAEVNALQAGVALRRATATGPNKTSLCTQVWVVVDYSPATLESYDDDIQTTVWGTVGDPYASGSGTTTAYIYGPNFIASHSYTVGYYDNGGTWVVDHNISSAGDNTFSSQYLLTTNPGAEAGTWHAVVFDDDLGGPPAAYAETSSAAGYMVEDDFVVSASAIPEFPTVMVGIMVAGLCFGIYYWMRKRRLAYVKA